METQAPVHAAPTEERVRHYLSMWLRIPLDELTDDRPIIADGRGEGLNYLCAHKFGRGFSAPDPARFTVRELINQLTH